MGLVISTTTLSAWAGYVLPEETSPKRALRAGFYGCIAGIILTLIMKHREESQAAAARLEYWDQQYRTLDYGRH